MMAITYTFLTMLADVAVKWRTENEEVGDEVVLGSKNGREVEEAAEIEEETCRKARGSKRRRGLSDAMSENLTGIKLGGRYLVGRYLGTS